MSWDGRERHRISLDWPLRMPVIDCRGGRVVFAGDRIASYRDGEPEWSIDGGPFRATSFEDGSLAVTQGADLLIVDRLGKTLTKLSAPEGEAFTSPPAIAAVGAIWVATFRGLYVAPAPATRSWGYS
ncbi:MAG: hypothetical protein U0414_36685 [Polyangiaceae bacterium]